MLPFSEKVAAMFPHERQKKTLGGIPVLEVRPADWQHKDKVILYVHGGCYVIGSVHSFIGPTAALADASGLRVVSIDYTLAPKAQFEEIFAQIDAVVKALIKEGFTPADMAIYGESAGGGLAAGTALMMRDNGTGLPAAIGLHSPWSDIRDIGDSTTTLKYVDKAYSYEGQLYGASLAYAGSEENWTHPWVSPVLADYSTGFSPTIIQGGTREIFLSHFVRHYQALDTAGVDVKLDLYEGMSHAFATEAPLLPESDIARRESRGFLQKTTGCLDEKSSL